ncbi:hypothetical protein ACE1AT_24905 [Pelatocladus sp. BLCC-F211]|uniref:hypothetical protein n=1 Tax=Pelatocladus sp. BLCC-F211 TaxID=3342752 RepID=UPI0035BAE9B7
MGARLRVFLTRDQDKTLLNLRTADFNIPGLKRCFLKLIAFMNDFRAAPMSFPIAS